MKDSRKVMPLRKGVLSGSASAPATCGELAQGVLGKSTVMVTCPIDLFATAMVDLHRGSGQVHGPPDSPKAGLAVALTLERLGRRDLDAILHLDSPIPRQKGMASSTADIAAAIGATAAALGESLTVHRQAEIALSIEPSDGVMVPGVALFDHRRGLVVRSLGNPPPIRVMVLEFDGVVDTAAFNATDRSRDYEQLSHRFRKAVDLIAAGVKAADPSLIARGATEDALAFQEVSPHPRLPEVLPLARRMGALGVNIAHSGTVVGVLLPDDPEMARTAKRILGNLSGLASLHAHRLIGGGVITPQAKNR